MSAGGRGLLGGWSCALAFVAACHGAAGAPPAAPDAARPPVEAPAPPRGATMPLEEARPPVETILGPELFNLQLDKAKLRASGASETLLDELGRSAFRYFRALAEPSKHRTCEAFRDLRWRLPSAPVHGDAHIEQFVVTDDYYGLADFDEAGFGPAIVDLVRYATSLHLACREVAGGCDAERAVSLYFDAYQAALDHPVQRRPPAIAARLRGRLG